ncbi:LysR family transcriptional regulator [Nitratireductor luteus]|uniref:LysR family transcriptional regulator n=1 Tax=Nitratireductor luteus TaxID=2976980 RepID=UPI002240C81A|nr:LysR family transcriptional regulator [Nitratireductor luteus]
MEMHEIRYFLAACRTLNFHRAAELANVTQPALTRAIQKLEAELGGLLFHRERNHVQLTDFGRLMRSHLEEILRRSEAAKETARGFLKLEAAPLALGVMCTIGPLRFVGFLNAFHERHPGIGITVIEGVPGRLTELLLEGKLDVALMAQPGPFEKRLRPESIYSERFGLAFCTGHPFEMRNMLHLSDVEGEPYLDRINCEYSHHIDVLCGERGIRITTAYRSEREDWIMAMVAAGMGVCFAPEFSVCLPGVCHRPVADPGVVREVSLVSVARRTSSPAVRAFTEAVCNYEWTAGTIAESTRVSE